MRKCGLLLSVFTLFFYFISTAQPWMYSENGTSITDFSHMQARAETLFAGKENSKGSGYKPYKRWENFWKNRLMADGTLPTAEFLANEKTNYLKNKPTVAQRSQANWASIGPNSMPEGLGRVNCIAFHPTNPNTFWIGTPSGGIWKTSDDGLSWTALGDNLPSMGVSDIVIHPTNPEIIYIATGDGEIGDTPSAGVLKSTDGGATWKATGLSLQQSQNTTIRRMVMDPNNPNMLLVAASNGLFRTENAGQSWQIVASGRFHDIEFKPFSSSVIYAAKTNFNGELLKSNDNGKNWIVLHTYPFTNRMAIAVTPANPDYVYWVTTATNTYHLTGLYRSTNNGNDATLRNNTLNIGNQCYYNLILQGNPTDANEIWLGGISTFQSLDGGLSFSYASGVMHVDAHTMEWKADGSYYQGNDGGVYKKKKGQTDWTFISNGLAISQVYRLGLSAQDDKILAGLQDNGVIHSVGNTWAKMFGGDGMHCFFDPNNSVNRYFSTQNGQLYRQAASVQAFQVITPPSVGKGAWITPFLCIKTSNSSHRLFSAYRDVYQSDDAGTTWQKISNFNSNNLKSLAVAPSNPNYIYAIREFSNTIYKTSDGGTTWTTLVFPTIRLGKVEISPTNPLEIWASIEGFIPGSAVFHSIDGGQTWTNISGSLPMTPVNCIEYQIGSQNGLYIGTDMGVFYTDDTMSDWEIFDSGLPSVPVHELEIDYNEAKIYAATYGRGLWKSDLFTSSTSGFLTLSPSAIHVNAAAQSSTISIQSNVTWSTAAPNWVSLNQNTGQQSSEITISFSENTSPTLRSGQVIFYGNNHSMAVHISQEGALPSPSCPNNLLQNDSYENGLQNWKGGGEPTSLAKSGQKALKICTYLARSFQTLAVEKNAIYDLSVFAKRDFGTSGVISVKFMTQNYQPITTEFYPISSTNYTLISERVLAPSDAVWVECSILQDGGTGCIYVDDWCLVKTTPAPSICQNNLVQNADFSANAAQWQQSNQNISFVSNQQSFDGTSVQICGNTQRIYQNIPIVGGKTYQLTAQAKQTGQAKGLFLVSFLNANWSQIETKELEISSDSYALHSLSAHAPNQAVYAEISFFNQDGSACVWADDICFSETTGQTANQVDLELSMIAQPLNPGQWQHNSIEVSLKNNGTRPESNIEVQLPAQSDPATSALIAYSNHTSAGNSTFQQWSGRWIVPQLAAGESITLFYQAYTRVASAIPFFAQVSQQNSTDADSAPSNNGSTIPKEDDEALVIINENLSFVKDTSTEQNLIKNTVFMYPNPASNILHIDLTTYLEEAVVLRLVDVLGHITLEKHVFSNKNYVLDLENVENGAYFLQVLSERQRPKVEQVLVEKGW